MSGLRVAMVTRRFWPLAGSDERGLAELGHELLQQGLVPAIVTARFDARWPSEIVVREMAVHRLAFPQRFGWGTMRYMIALSRWLRRNRPDIDLVYVSHLSLEAHATIGAFQDSGIPVVLRAAADEPLEGAGTHHRRRLASRVMRRCQSAPAVVTSSESTRERLLDAGFLARRVHLIRDGVALAAERTEANKLAARAALAGVNEDLRVGLNMPVVTWLGPFHPQYDINLLVTAWRHVAREQPHARLWLIGDGPQRERLHRSIRDADLFGRVLMPGTFDEIDDVLRASDLLVVPSAAVDQSSTILQAMAGHVPVLVANGPGHDNLVRDGVTGRTLVQHDSDSLASAMLAALSERQHGMQMAVAAYDFVAQNHSLRQTAVQHRQLFHDLIRSSQRLVP